MSSSTFADRVSRLMGIIRVVGIAAGILLTPRWSAAQTVAIRVSGIDMYGGIVLPDDSNVGVAFGARLGLADLFNGAARAGIELDWWTADRRGVDLEVRDIVGGFGIWREIGGWPWLRPFLGAGTALHSVDVSRVDGTRLPAGESPEADRLDGYRLGAAVFGGLTLRLTRTGAIWLVIEYRYAAVSAIAHHEIRAGARLLAAKRRGQR